MNLFNKKMEVFSKGPGKGIQRHFLYGFDFVYNYYSIIWDILRFSMFLYLLLFYRLF